MSIVIDRCGGGLRDARCVKCGESDEDYDDGDWPCMGHHFVCVECGGFLCDSCYDSMFDDNCCDWCARDVCRKHNSLKKCIDCNGEVLLCTTCTSCCDFKPKS